MSNRKKNSKSTSAINDTIVDNTVVSEDIHETNGTTATLPNENTNNTDDFSFPDEDTTTTVDNTPVTVPVDISSAEATLPVVESTSSDTTAPAEGNTQGDTLTTSPVNMEATPTPIPTPVALLLSNTDLTALRKSDRIHFTHTNGKGTIRCIKSSQNRGPFKGQDLEYSLTVQSITIVFTGKGIETEYNHPNIQCSEMVYGSSRIWKTIVHILKLEDELRLKWVSSSNESTRNARLHQDMLYLQVRRGEKTWDEPMEFLLTTLVSPDNTARMIQELST